MVKALKILRFLFISLSILCSVWTAKAQSKGETVKYGISLGVDISRFLVPLLDPERSCFEINGRITYKDNWFVTGDLGYESVNFDTNSSDKKSYSYQSNGSFFRLGMDYDFFTPPEPDADDNIFVGLRYGFAVQEQESPLYTITEEYWGSYSSSISMHTVTSHWIELTLGLRTEVLKNFHMGWMFRFKGKLASDSQTDLQPYTIPGYGKGGENFNMGVAYILEYQIPWRGTRR
ncbi:DUF6048 family protein [bacterium]|nr:DUF6048 family protein [bacterium]